MGRRQSQYNVELYKCFHRSTQNDNCKHFTHSRSDFPVNCGYIRITFENTFRARQTVISLTPGLLRATFSDCTRISWRRNIIPTKKYIKAESGVPDSPVDYTGLYGTTLFTHAVNPVFPKHDSIMILYLKYTSIFSMRWYFWTMLACIRAFQLTICTF